MSNIPPPPPGFQIVQAPPPPPPGFQIVGQTPAAPPTPPGVDAATGLPMAVPPPSLNVPASPAPAEEPSLVDTIMDGAGNLVRRGGYLAQEFTRGATNMLGAPVDLLNVSPMLLNLLPGEQGMGPISENPVGGSASIRAGVNAPRDVILSLFGYAPGDLEPQDRFDRIGGRVAQEFGAMSVPAVGMTARAQTLGTTGTRAMQESSSGATRFAGRALEPYAVNPTRTLARDGAFAAAAGTGAGVAREMAPEGDEELYDIIGALGGVAAAGLGAGALNTSINAVRAVTGRTDDVVKEAAARTLAENANAPVTPSGARDTAGLARDIAEGPRIGATVPGFRETTADVTQNPGLAAAEYSRSAGPNAGEFTMRRQQNAQAADAAIDGLAPTGDPARFRANLDASVQTELSRRVQAAEEAQRNLDDALARVQPGGTETMRGSAIRSELVAARDRALDEVSELFNAVDAEGIQVDLGALRQRFDDVVSRLPENDRRRFMPAEVDTLRALAPEDAEAAVGPLREVQSVRSGLSSDMRAAATTDQQRFVTGQFRDELDAYLDDLVANGESGLDEAARGALQQGQQMRFDVGRRFETPGTAIADSLRTTDRGQFLADPSSIPGRFAQPDSGRVNDFTALMREAGDSPQVREAIIGQVVQDAQPFLRRPEQLARFMSERSIVLSNFPELQTRLRNVGATQEALDAAMNARTSAEARLTPGSPTAVGQFTRFGPEDATNSMRTVIQSDRPAEAVDELLRQAGNSPENVEGLRAAFWQTLEAKARPMTSSNRTAGGQDTWNFTRLARALEDPKMAATAERLYADNPEHLENIRTIAETLRSANFGQTGRAAGTSGTAQGLLGSEILPSTETVASRAFAFQRGQVGMGFLATNMGSIILRRAMLKGRTQEFNRLVDAALLDPDLAQSLVTDYNPANLAALRRSATVHFGVRIAQLDDLLADEGEDDEVMNAIGTPEVNLPGDPMSPENLRRFGGP